jgi:hypothetical protein
MSILSHVAGQNGWGGGETAGNIVYVPADVSGVICVCYKMGWDLAEWLERCASIMKITGSNPSGGSEFTFRSDLLSTARGGCT